MPSRSRSSGALTEVSMAEPWYSSDKVACQGNLIRTNRGNRTAIDYVGQRRTMYDEVVADFRKRSAKGEVFMNRMSSLVTELTPAVLGGPLVFTGSAYQCSGAAQYQSLYELPSLQPLISQSGHFMPVSGWWQPSPLLSNQQIEAAIDEASTRCHNNRGRAETNLWETIAERKQTYAMLSSTLSSIKEITRTMETRTARREDSLVRYLVKNYSKATIGAAGLWLMARYGLIPLIKDVRALMKQLQESLDQAERHTARGTSTVERVSPSSGTSNLGHVNENWSIVETDALLVRAMSLDEWKVSMADHFGLGYKGLVTLPWDLLTLSFVADWIVNVGDFVGAMAPLPGVTQRGACISYTRVRSKTVTVSGYSPNGIASVYSSATLSKTGVSTEKVRVPGLRSPTLVRLNRSKIDPELQKNHVRIVDACALVGQRLARVTHHLASHLIVK